MALKITGGARRVFSTGFISPYAVMFASLLRSHETTSAVTLEDEGVLGAQATVGVVARFSAARIGIEYRLASVRSLSVKVGFGRSSN